MERRVDDLEGADVLAALGLVGEGGVNNHSVEVAVVASSEGSLGKFDVVVLKGEWKGGTLDWPLALFLVLMVSLEGVALRLPDREADLYLDDMGCLVRMEGKINY